MHGTDADDATLYLGRSAAPNRVPMTAQLLGVLRSKRVNWQIAGRAELLQLGRFERRSQSISTLVLTGHEPRVEQGVKVPRKQQAVEDIKALVSGFRLAKTGPVLRTLWFGNLWSAECHNKSSFAELLARVQAFQ
jgi:hypothetical protein